MAQESFTLTRIRAALLWTLVLGAAGTLAELLLIGHDESAPQYVPLVLLVVGILGGAAVAYRPSPGGVRLLQLLMVLYVGGGVLGVGLHYQGNEEFELEMHPSIAGRELLTKVLTGATPVLAPGSMSLLGIVGLVYTYRHPLLRLHAPDVPSEEARS